MFPILKSASNKNDKDQDDDDDLKNNERVKELMMTCFSENTDCVTNNCFTTLFANITTRFNNKLQHGGWSTEVSTWNAWSPLHYAVAYIQEDVVKYLLEHQANVNKTNDQGASPLHLACIYFCAIPDYVVDCTKVLYFSDYQCRMLKIVKLLLEYNCNVNETDFKYRTPLFCAIEILNRIKKINISSEESKYQEIKKFSNDRKELISLLLNYGADVTITDCQNNSILHYLSTDSQLLEEADKIELCKIFLSKGADVNAATHFNVTPLFLSLRNQQLDLSKSLINCNAQINIACTNFNEFTPLHALIYYNLYSEKSCDILNLLLQKGANVNAREVNKATALHIAMDYHGMMRERNNRTGSLTSNKDEMAVALLKNGAEIDAKNDNGQTPLHRACNYQYLEGAKVLLDYGADINEEDEFLNTPIAMACSRICSLKNVDFLCLLRNHVHKLKTLDFRVSTHCRSNLMQLESLYLHTYELPDMEYYICTCKAEIEKMKSVKLDNYTSLYSIIFKSLNSMANHVKNDTFKEILSSNKFDEEYEEYGYLLRLQYERGLKRLHILPTANDCLRILTECELPDSCIEVIFEYLTDSDLQNLIAAARK